MEIRRAVFADADVVFALASRLATSFAPERPAFDAAFRAALLTEPCAVLVASTADGVVGYLLGFDHPAFFANGRIAYLEEMVVAPEARGQGVGRALAEAFEAWARQRPCRLVALATRRADGFYRALGYEESATYFRKLL